jgi:co-chaperonin GroES (HSP10)
MLKAIGKNILVKPLVEERKDKILTTTERKPYAYEVLSVGEDVTYVKIGDHVCLQQYGIHQHDFKGEKVYLTSQDHVYARVH